MTSVIGEGTRAAVAKPPRRRGCSLQVAAGDALAEHDDALLAAYVHGETSVSSRRMRDALAVQTKQALVHPVFLGSAITGAGVDSLMSGIAELLPREPDQRDGGGPT